MYSTHKKGQIAVCEVQRRALDNDAIISIPTTEERYDLIIDYEGKLYKAQVKYTDHQSPKASGSTTIDLRSKCRNNNYIKKYQRDEVDVILAYIKPIDKIVWVFPDMFHDKGSLTIRYEESKSNRVKKTHMLKDFKVW